ncbi:MAG: iron-containing alcohol dehydrogenase [Dehalococcoidales bacterium]|nr:iron-containing alcohol dehydrogenase [Dehalococcoidales bacterium]
MPYFFSPKVLFGSGMLKRFGSEIEGRGTKATIITDKVMAASATPIVEVVKAAEYEVNIWDGANREPSVDLAVEASQVLKEHNPQLILAFGGGSVIDAAKAAWVLYERPEMTGSDLVAVNPRSKLNLRKKAKFVAVPTTSGTGSDATWAIVVTDTANHRKIGFANAEILPDITLLVPEFTAGMPKILTASTGMDVLGHAIDGLTARQQTDFSDGMCLQAMKLTFEWLPKACADGSDLIARGKMQNAATIAGIGFGNSNTSLSHALGHALGSVFNLPHGRSIGVALTYSIDFIATNPAIANAPNPLVQLGLAARFAGINASSDADAAKKIVAKIKELQKEISEPLCLKDLGITEDQMKPKLDSLVVLAAKDVNMYSSPCECKEEQLKQLFMNIWQGKT